jgi:DegV family protein with EDD domain
MAVRIVTDSGADIPQDIANDLGIIIVPLHIMFGQEDYLDEVSITKEQLYQRLGQKVAHPLTSTPSPGEIAQVYRNLAGKGAAEIVSIHISSKLSKTYGSALQAKEIVGLSLKDRLKIAVIDSGAVTMGLGMLVIQAARLAKEGKGLNHITQAVKESISTIHVIGALESLDCLVRGGRLPKIALAAHRLKIKTFVRLAEGKLQLMGVVRTAQKKTEKLLNFVRQFPPQNIEAVAVEYTTNLKEAETLKERVGEMFHGVPIYLTRIGAALGVHGGLETIVLGVKTKH